MTNPFNSIGIPLEPPPTQPPICKKCKRASEYFITRRSNRNGNAGRPCYKCLPCDNFLVFCDRRGNDPENPKCHCGYSSKRQITGRSKSVPGRVHYVCRLGECDFYSPSRDENGQDNVIAGELADKLSRLSFI
ncbi:hypothetical protein F4810DRAFT_656258 [Camillea tinctor]|nr:hypothetical protein F4810DRAFT_656258 [Camillea tinctor]